MSWALGHAPRVAVLLIASAAVRCASGDDPQTAFSPADDASPADAGHEAEASADAKADVASDAPVVDVDAPDGACAPDCAGKTCGADGCGGYCAPGCPIGTTCLATGQCKDGCLATFRVAFPGIDLRAVSFKSPRDLYVAGTLGMAGYLARIDGCDGVNHATVGIDSVSAPVVALTAVVHDQSRIYVAGNASPSPGAAAVGLVAAVDQSMFVPSWSNVIGATTAGDRLSFAVMDGEGLLWTGGLADEAQPKAWLTKWTSTGSSCGFLSASDPGAASAATFHSASGTTYVTGQSGTSAYVASYPASSCWDGSGACAGTCEPGWSATFDIGSAYTVATGIVATGSYSFVSGYTADAEGADPTGFVAVISLATGAVAGSYALDASPGGDAYTALVAQGGFAYAVGATGLDESWEQGRMVVSKLLLPTLEEVWTSISPTEQVPSGAVLDDAGGLFIVSSAQGGSTMIRCTEAGFCP